MSPKYTEQSAVEKVLNLHSNLIYLGGFIVSYKNCKWKCNICGYEFEASPAHLFKKEGIYCANCNHKRCLSASEVNEKIQKEHDGKVKMIESTFIFTNKPALMECNEGHQWWAKPIDVYTGSKNGCGKCSHKVKQTYDEVKERVDILFDGTLYFSREDYEVSYIKTPIYCKICGHTFFRQINQMLHRKNGCPNCRLHSIENVVIKALDNKFDDRKNFYYHNLGIKGCFYNGGKLPLRADFQFKKYPLIIETDGKQHFIAMFGEDDFKLIQSRDVAKNEFCKKNGICLIRVTSSPKWGTEKHITLQKLLELIDLGIDEQGNVNMQVFKPYDFNRE